MRWLIVAGALVISIPAVAQVNSRPTDPPIVSAENDAYRLGEPVVVSGEFYYPAGPITFFNGNVMVRVGHYEGALGTPTRPPRAAQHRVRAYWPWADAAI